MSWNKNTCYASEVDARIEILKEFGVEYRLQQLGQVANMGLEVQYYPNDESVAPIHIRALEYKDGRGIKHLFVEQMQRHPDCDSDDVLVSFHYQGDAAEVDLTTWPVEFVLPDDSYHRPA